MNKQILILSLTLVSNLFSFNKCNPRIDRKLFGELENCADHKTCTPHQKLLLLALTCCLKSEQEVITKAEQIYGDTNYAHLYKKRKTSQKGIITSEETVILNDIEIITSGDKNNKTCRTFKQFVKKKENERIEEIKKKEIEYIKERAEEDKQTLQKIIDYIYKEN